MSKRNLKFTNKIKEVGPRLKWLAFSEIQDYKLTSSYIDFLCPQPNTKVSSIEQLEAIVKEALIKEFSPEIQNKQSFQYLVDAVMNRIQKKSLGEK